ncbi:retrovirus-related Pol polyprotein from transposon 17.6 [Trichonephila clavipes]|nr:retrovirus-related Pol polyprotein from transposon 17.6 [Trichonephila clavipes]
MRCKIKNLGFHHTSAEGIPRGQGGDDESASFKTAGFRKAFPAVTDATSIGVDAVLNKEQRPVVFAYCTLSRAERNYTVTQRDCLAVVWALDKFRPYLGTLPIKVITDHAALTRLTHVIRDLVLSSREQLIEGQRKDLELDHIYRYLENPEDSSVNATICENWCHDFKMTEGMLFYANYATSFDEMRVYIRKSLRNEIMRKFHEKPIAGHLGRFKTYSRSKK